MKLAFFFSLAAVVISQLLHVEVESLRLGTMRKGMKVQAFQGEPDNDLSNACMPWLEEEDKYLYENFIQGKGTAHIASELRRGLVGVQKRIDDINNPSHFAHIRLFGEFCSNDKKKKYLRPCKDILQRLLWDDSIDIDDFTFVYSDRFNGNIEAALAAPNKSVKGKERLLVKAIPEHRIQSIK